MTDDNRGYDRLDDLEPENVSLGSTSRLDFVLDQLADAKELSNGLTWKSELWEGVTVEELLGALIEADWILEEYRAETGAGYMIDYRLRGPPDIDEEKVRKVVRDIDPADDWNRAIEELTDEMVDDESLSHYKARRKKEYIWDVAYDEE